MINKKTFFKSLIILSLIIVIIVVFIQIRNTLARYETTATAERDVDVAFWIVENSFKSERLLIEDIYPSTNTFNYTFTVSNFNGSKKAETDLEYELVLTTTTNLPISYNLYRNGTALTGNNKIDELYTDEDGTYYREIKLGTGTTKFILEQGEDRTDTFIVSVTFPQENSANEQYADLMENIKIDLSAKQIIDE